MARDSSLAIQDLAELGAREILKAEHPEQIRSILSILAIRRGSVSTPGLLPTSTLEMEPGRTLGSPDAFIAPGRLKRATPGRPWFNQVCGAFYHHPHARLI
jgi:hypothetical protein